MAKTSAGVIKVTTSGQVTLPKAYRDQFDTNLFVYEIDGQTFIVQPLKIEKPDRSKQYHHHDIHRFVFSSKNKREKNLARKIDQILYGAD